ncbi:uncharacterized protein LOC111026334 [Myzus persicae]|uniref:uncharacterized protein LOC111026334 n=1 Tax=Myzus persicae TaxID=13164 RepID=UPI000B937402|nr:uncharacterized protein LOC111026334 [Myzus persicae]
MIDDELAKIFNKLFHLKENVQQINRVEPIKIEKEIEGKIVSMELDTGTSVSIISEHEYRKKFGEIKLETDGLKLQYYTNETIDTLGHIQVNIKYENKKFKGKWYVLKGQGPMLLGREWLKEMGTLSDLCINNSIRKTLLNIDLNNIDNAIVEKFPEVFSNELELYKGEEIELVLVDSAKPKFF